MIRRRDSEVGVAFLEVLVAAGLFSIVLLALPSMLVSVTHTNFQARDMTAAMSLAQGKLEALRNQPYAAVASGADTSSLSVTGSTTDDLTPYTRRWTVSTGPVSGTKEVTIRIEWTHQRSRHLELRTIIRE